MSPVVVVTLVGLPSLAASVSLVKAVKSQWPDRSGATFLVLAAGAMYNGPVILASLLGQKIMTVDAYGSPVAYLPHWLDPSTRNAQRLLVALAVAFFIRNLGPKVRINPVPVVLAFLCTLILLIDALHHNPSIAGFYTYTSAAAWIALLLAASVAIPGRGACIGAAVFGVALACTTGILLIFHFDDTAVRCVNKCGVLGYNIVGPMAHENVLGIALVVTIPFVWISIRDARRRRFLTLYVGAIAALTGSRTSALVAIVVVGAILLAHPKFDEDGRLVVHPIKILKITGRTSLLIGMSIPIFYRYGTGLTGRGQLWGIAEDLLRQTPLLGWGARTWPALAVEGVVPHNAGYSVHNQWLDVLFVSGLVGFLIFVIALTLLFRICALEERPAVWALILPMLVAGVLERTWSVAGLDWVSYGVLATLMTIPSKRSRQREPNDEARAVLALSRAPSSHPSPMPS